MNTQYKVIVKFDGRKLIEVTRSSEEDAIDQTIKLLKLSGYDAETENLTFSTEVV